MFPSCRVSSRLLRNVALAALLLSLPRSSLKAQAAGGARLLRCADGAARDAGFQPIVLPRAGWLGFTRLQDTPGFDYLLDSLAIGVGGDTTAPRLELRLTSHVMSHMSNQSLGRTAPPPALLAWADTVRTRCNPH